MKNSSFWFERFDHVQVAAHKDGGPYSDERPLLKEMRVINNPNSKGSESPTVVGRDDEAYPFLQARAKDVLETRQLRHLASDVGKQYNLRELIETVAFCEDRIIFINALSDVEAHIRRIPSIPGLMALADLRQVECELLGVDHPDFYRIFFRHTHSPRTTLVFPNWSVVHAKIALPDSRKLLRIVAPLIELKG